MNMRKHKKIHISATVKNGCELSHKRHKKKQKSNYKKYLRILDFYTNQWYHREQGYWSKTVVMFFASLIVSVLPYFEPFQLKTPENIPQIVFPLIGIVLCILSMIFSLSLASRMSIVIDKVQTIANMFPAGLKWTDGKENYPFLSIKMAKYLSVTMFSLLIVLDIILVLYSSNIIFIPKANIYVVEILL